MNIRPTLAGLALSILLLPAAIAQPTNYPLTVENCGRILTFEATPQKVVSLGQAMHEILYALNLGPRMTGTAVWWVRSRRVCGYECHSSPHR